MVVDGMAEGKKKYLALIQPFGIVPRGDIDIIEAESDEEAFRIAEEEEATALLELEKHHITVLREKLRGLL